MKRKTFTITEEQYSELLEAIHKPEPVMFLSGGIPLHRSRQEIANDAWRKLGDSLGFDHMSVMPGSHKLEFTAVEKPFADALEHPCPKSS